MINRDVVASNRFYTGAPAAPQAAPANFTAHVVRREYLVAKPKDVVWRWLMDPRTFTESQIFPWRVEFVSADPATPPGFHVGGLNVHHGPGMLFAGTMTEIRDGEYRDLQYFYGSHFVSMRLVRPTRLQFWVESTGDAQTKITLQLDSLVVRWFAPIWSLGNRFFWGSFGRWVSRSA